MRTPCMRLSEPGAVMTAPIPFSQAGATRSRPSELMILCASEVAAALTVIFSRRPARAHGGASFLFAGFAPPGFLRAAETRKCRSEERRVGKECKVRCGGED